MSYLPILKGGSNIKFANPLSGFVYDNKKYAESCIIEAMPSRSNIRCRSIPHSFFKQTTSKPIPTASSQDLLEREFRLTKVMNITKRLSDHIRLRCTRNKWMQEQAETPHHVKKTAPIQQMLPNKHRDYDSKAFRFPEIQALILSVFRSAADHDKVCKLSLKSYFQLFFKDTLAGILFPDLIAIVDKYLKVIYAQEQNTENSQIKVQLDNEFANILSKQELYNKLVQLQNLGKQEQAEKVVRAYCLPLPQVRAVFMQDLLKLISVQLYENFNCNRQSQYILLRENGQPIVQFAAIGFSTTFLFIAQKDSAQEQYQNYTQITHNHSRLKNRFQFRQQLKLNFRQKVVKGNFFDSSNSVEKSTKQAIHERKINVERAQMIVDSKNDKNNASRLRLKQMTGTNEAFRDTKSKSKQKSIDKVGKEKEAKPSTIHYSIDRKIDQQFKVLKHKNDISNTVLKNDETAKNKIQLSILIKESVYFKEKSFPQIERILVGLGFINVGEQYKHYHQHLITVQDYARMRKIINCVGQREYTIRFIDRYLRYDDFGELTREDFRHVLAFIIDNEGKTADVVLNTIWSWLQHNGVTSSNWSIRQLDMQILYERNKLVYYFLISLIFGTNEVSVLELTQDMLVDG